MNNTKYVIGYNIVVDKNKDYSIYCHITPSGRKYVGISCSPVRRWDNGKNYKHNFLFDRAIKKYGWDNIQPLILYSGLSVDEAKEIERKLIKEWKLTNHRYGYNISPGANSSPSLRSRMLMSKARKGKNYCEGRILSAETKSKISSSLKEYFKDHKPAFYGRHHSPETINILKNKVVSEETRQKMKTNHHDVSGKNNPSARPIRQLSMSGELLFEYDYAKQAAIKYNIDLSSIIKCCKGKVKSCGGYKWEYK